MMLASVLSAALTIALAQNPLTAPAGTASVSGRVMIDDGTDNNPLRRASVMLTLEGVTVGWTSVTDDSGAFAFTQLPPGRYLLSASKPTFVPMAYGALKTGRPGQWVVVSNGARVSALTIRLPRGATISGVVVDELGAPIATHYMALRRVVVTHTERTTVLVHSEVLQVTDDRGQYRFYGLPAGEYVVQVSPANFVNSAVFHRVSPADLDAALRRLPEPPRSTDEPSDLTDTLVYYPGTTNAAEAGVIAVGAGEERSGANITLQRVPAVTIRGQVASTGGTLPRVVTLVLAPTADNGLITRTRSGSTSWIDGSFSFEGVPPGQYTVIAQASPEPRAVAPINAPLNATLFARADVTVTGRDLPPITLTLEDGVTVSGIVQTDAASAGIDPRAVRVGLEPIIGRNDVAIGVQAVAPDANGAFAITGVPPGRYRVTIDTGVSGRAILPKSATLQSTNALDDGIQVSGSDLSGLDVTITSLAAEISGSLQDASGRAATDFYVIVFPDDRKFWTMNSRRIKTARPGVDGTFVLRNLPPGNYRIAAVTDVDTNEWFEPTFLSQLVSASAQITLAEGEKKAFPLKLGGG